MAPLPRLPPNGGGLAERWLRPPFGSRSSYRYALNQGVDCALRIQVDVINGSGCSYPSETTTGAYGVQLSVTAFVHQVPQLREPPDATSPSTEGCGIHWRVAE